MTPDCRVRVARALGRDLSDAEAGELDARLARSERYLRKNDPEFGGLDRKGQLARAADHASGLLQAEADGLVRSYDIGFRLREAGRDALGADFDALERSGRVTMMDRASDLPQYRNGVHDDALAVTLDDGRVVMFRDRMSPEAVPEILLHEVGVHAGMEGYLGRQGWLDLKQQAADMLAAGDEAALQAAARVPGDTSPAHYLEEVIAHWVQFGPARDQLVKTAMGKMRAWIYRHIPWVRGRVSLTHAMLKELAQGALRRETRQARKLVRQGDGPLASVPADGQGRFAKSTSRVLPFEEFSAEMRAIRDDWADDEIARAYDLHRMIMSVGSGEAGRVAPSARPQEAREPVPDQGLQAMAEDALEARGGAGTGLIADSDALEARLREDIEASGADPEAAQITHPDTNETVAVKQVLDELDRERSILERLRGCAYPGGA